MAYTKTSNKTQDKDVRYLNKDYQSFKNQLIEFTKTYYPETFNNFSEGSPGMMFLEIAAYVGDVLSFYTDTQIQENFLLLAKERKNLYNLAYVLGYTPKITAAASVDLDVYQLVPSKTNSEGAYIPDFQYALTILESSKFQSTTGKTFSLTKDVNFSNSGSLDPTTIETFSINSADNPEYYLLKKSVNAISAEIKTKTFSIGDAEQFLTLNLFDNNIIKIEKIVDAQGNQYHEVPYLAQDTIFERVKNTGANDPELHQYNQQTPYLLKIKKVPRRFVSRFRENNELEIQFGAGVSDQADVEIIPNPDNIGLGIKDGRSNLDVAYDPSNFLHTRAYGVVPKNTALTVTYLVGGGLGANVESNTITLNTELIVQTKPNLNVGLTNYIKSNITATNPQKASGGGDGDTIEEIRMNAMASFAAQKRTVTKEDYMIRTLSMPSELGKISKVFITQDDQLSPLISEPGRFPNPLALNLYTLGYNKDKQLENLNSATKQNLANYLGEFRSLTDAINILDAKPINFDIEFIITTFKDYSNQEVILNCINEIREYFNVDRWQINQPIIISEIKNLIGNVIGVQTVEDVIFENINGEELGYSKFKYDFDTATRNGVIYPSLDPSIFELKYPNTDIRGKVTTY